MNSPMARIEGDKIAVMNSYTIREAIKTIPGARFDPKRKIWTTPRSPVSAKALACIIGNLPPDIANMIVELAPERRSDAELLLPIPSWSPVGPAWNHQVRATRWLVSHEAALLNYGLGTGKTRATLDAIRLLGAQRVLVICPLRVCAVWAREAEKHHPGHFAVLPLDSGGSRQKAKRITNTATWTTKQPLIVSINYEGAWRAEVEAALNSVEWDVIVLDEVHRCRTPSSTQSIFVTRFCKRVPRRWALSGTPLAQRPTDAYAIFRALDQGVFGSSFYQFKSRFCVMGGYGGYEILGYRNLDEFRERFLALTLTADRSTLDLPEALHEVVPVILPPDALRTHDEIRREFVTFLKEGGAQVTTPNILTQLLRMQQVASGHVKADDGTIRIVHTEKMQALADILEDLDPAEPVVVFCKFRYDIEQIQQACIKAGRECFRLTGDKSELELWKQNCAQANRGMVLAANIQAGAEGIDLTLARYCIYYDVPFSLAQYEQSLARIHRPGQTRSVVYYHLVATGTVDQYVRSSLKNRKNVIDSILDDGGLTMPTKGD